MRDQRNLLDILMAKDKSGRALCPRRDTAWRGFPALRAAGRNRRNSGSPSPGPGNQKCCSLASSLGIDEMPVIEPA
jgi:hypothetical protein